ncbi:hypothetical protein [Albidovulum sediminis]|uniref:Lipoprotein n=1 Tax=Albidovulum sediminis TaxID=3066345 RepID=A0ABT2NI11_9RHOB|nr:hypothetical protein [Defluviimonas sediminis]MCT8328548.1 hypothetical protein [Defluviimonas sediminis]
MALALFVACASACKAEALTLEQCEQSYEAYVMAPHGSEGGYEDVGDSQVMFVGGFGFEGQGYSYRTLVHCRSGETLTVIVSRRGVEAEFDRDNEVEKYLRTAVESKESITFPELREQMAALGLEATLERSTKEICPCKAHYPADRYGKTPYVYSSAFVEMEPDPVHEKDK